MKNILIPSYYAISKFTAFCPIKPYLITFLNSSPSSKNFEGISEVDWEAAEDFNRPWVKYIFPLLSYNLVKLSRSLGYSGIIINQIWFQKYKHSDNHVWHIHSGSYTGVFYVEFPQDSPKTQLLLNEKVIDLEAEEGDIVIFPSFIKHRSPVNTSNNSKIIISYNLDLIM